MTSLYVGNLAYQTTSADLQTAFGRFGDVTSASVVSDRETGRSRGFGFVDMSNDDEAQEAITRHLSRLLSNAQVSVSLLQASGIQPVAGEHLIGPDGFVNLGVYGSVFVAGMTVDEARLAIEEKLAKFMDQPKISVDVLIYNSQFFYIITEGAGFLVCSTDHREPRASGMCKATA